ncbi:phosphatase [Vibrio sp. UCD-FRSSP16_10]|uniref:phosphatase domain-containing putative toxin n=1 Tax=unclassified Vibrio TaxID=2614977 RepID=UPI0007FE7DF6|nr:MULTISPECIES: dual specificity protein phosphatase family protein [unclassified Vibrio]OBT10196.1 phosphatase [Vibrio sp. UCD-FRSSP16_30]OBT18986.1 phosphatase [Vibrio sp. UCD-FRSSP16_10]
MTHPTWELSIDHGATLVLTPCPGTKELGLDESLLQLKEQGVKAIVTAINQAEMTEKNVEALGEKSKALGLQWFHLPIEDDDVPDGEFAELWAEVSPELHKLVNSGDKIAMHCMGGSGRTGLLAANLLLELNWSLPKVVTEVKALRPGAFTKPAQVNYVEALVQG